MNDETRATILVVEDDPATRTFLADNLTADGYEVLVTGCCTEAWHLLGTKFPDMTLLDVELPDLSGLDLLARVRGADGVASRVDRDAPVILVSGRTAELDRVRGFDRGADDYLCKPFSYVELRGRIEAVLRRADGRRRTSRLRVGDLEVDPVERSVRLHGEVVDLSQKEFALLRVLATDPTRVYTKEELLKTVWGFRSYGTTRTLDSHCCRLRGKLGRFGERFVVNVWGVGYRLVDSPGALAEAA